MQSVVKNITQKIKRVVSFMKTLKIAWTWRSVLLTVAVFYFLKDDLSWLFFGTEIELNTPQKFILNKCVGLYKTGNFFLKLSVHLFFALTFSFLVFNSLFIYYIKKLFNKFNIKSIFYNKTLRTQQLHLIDILKRFFKNL